MNFKTKPLISATFNSENPSFLLLLTQKKPFSPLLTQTLISATFTPHSRYLQPSFSLL